MISENKFLIFSGSSNEKLAGEIARHLHGKLGQSVLDVFSDGEIRFQSHENVRGADVFIVQSLCKDSNFHIMELLLMADAFKRASARRITAVITYYAYARQDRKDRPRVAISARLLADLLETAGFSRVLTIDLHAAQIQGFFNIPVDTLTSLPILSNYIKEKNLKDIVVVAPDTGRAKVAKKLADRVGAQLAILHKVRGAHHQSEVTHVVGDVKGKTVIITDDMIDTAGTITNGVSALRAEGCNKDVYVVATHGIFSGPAVERMEKAGFAEVVVTDTVPITKEKMFKGLKVLSSAELLGEAIRRNYDNQSITSLFD